MIRKVYQLATIRALARYWARSTTGARSRARLNAYPQFITEIDGLDIHFLHIRSKHENALPLIVTHGWPGSIIEQLKIIEPLTNPTAHGGSASDAFHLVIPSMPGYGFSGKPTTTGWGPEHIARAWVVLMKRLGYKKFGGARRRLGRDHHRADGRARACGIGRHPYQHAQRDSCRHRQGGVLRCAGAVRSLARREDRLRAPAVRLPEGHRLRLPAGVAPADHVRPGGFAGRPGRPISSTTTSAAIG